MAGVNRSDGPPVGIFWDLENVVPSHEAATVLAQRYANIARMFGELIAFKAFFDFQCLPGLLTPSRLSTVEGLELIDCPHENKSEQADKRLIVDMLDFAHEHRPGAIVILISQDADFHYALSSIRSRGNFVVVIARHAPQQVSHKLRRQAHVVIEWEECQDLDSVRQKVAAFERDTHAHSGPNDAPNHITVARNSASSAALSRSSSRASSFAFVDNDGYETSISDEPVLVNEPDYPTASTQYSFLKPFGEYRVQRWVSSLSSLSRRMGFVRSQTDLPCSPTFSRREEVFQRVEPAVISADASDDDFTSSGSDSETSESSDDTTMEASLTLRFSPHSPSPQGASLSSKPGSPEIVPLERFSNLSLASQAAREDALSSNAMALSSAEPEVTPSTPRPSPPPSSAACSPPSTAGSSRIQVADKYAPLLDILKNWKGAELPLRSQVTARLSKLPAQFSEKHHIKASWVEYLKDARASQIVVFHQNPKLRIALHPRLL